MDGAECGLGLGGWSFLGVRVPPPSFAGGRSGAFSFASTSTSFAFGWMRTAAFAFAAIISSLSFVSLKGDGVVRQGRVLVAQSTELEVGIFRKAGECIELDHLCKLEGSKYLETVAVCLNCVIGILVDGLKEPV